ATRVASLVAPNKITLAVAVPAGGNAGWSVDFAPVLAAKQDGVAITAATDNGDGTTSLKLPSAATFALNSRVTAVDNAAANPVDAVVTRVDPGNVVVVNATLGAAYTGGGLRLADWAAGQKTLRVAVPTPFGLGTVFTRGTLVRV